MERLLRELEYLATVASVTVPDKYQYPKSVSSPGLLCMYSDLFRKALDAIWKDIMLNQFHDVIPGTSIRMANEDAWAIYDARLAETETLIEQAMDVLLTGPSSEVSPEDTGSVVLDPLRLARLGVIESTSQSLHQTKAKHVLIETDESGHGRVIDLPSSMVSPTAAVTAGKAVLENPHFRLVISEGRITSLIDVQLQRELILPGPGANTAGLMLYDDFPLAYDAWDAEIYHLDQCREIKFTKVEVGIQDKLRASIRATAKFGSSNVILTV
jgi:alpha-mannosidase